MPTPLSGTISMDNMRDEITRSTGSVSMSEIRTRSGRSGAISFNQMYGCEGWTQVNGYFASKTTQWQGWHPIIASSSVSPEESGGSGPTGVVFSTTSPGSRATAFFKVSTTANSTLSFSNNTGGITSFTTNYQPSDVSRIVAANVSRSFSTTSGSVSTSYIVANTGTIHCMVQF
jgi:hypothetical protein